MYGLFDDEVAPYSTSNIIRCRIHHIFVIKQPVQKISALIKSMSKWSTIEFEIKWAKWLWIGPYEYKKRILCVQTIHMTHQKLTIIYGVTYMRPNQAECVNVRNIDFWIHPVWSSFCHVKNMTWQKELCNENKSDMVVSDSKSSLYPLHNHKTHFVLVLTCNSFCLIKGWFH